jgi:hypothetical protein
VRISRIQLSGHLLPAVCAASQADGSPFLPSDTADTVYTGTDSSSASGQTANCIGVCVGAITAARSARPNRTDGRSGCCCRPGNRYTTHSGSDSTSESPRRSTRYWETIGPPRVPELIPFIQQVHQHHIGRTPCDPPKIKTKPFYEGKTKALCALPLVGTEPGGFRRRLKKSLLQLPPAR